MPHFPSPCWDETLTQQELNKIHAEVTAKACTVLTQPLKEFAQQADAVFVLLSNKLEQTMPEGVSETSTYLLVRSVLDGTDPGAPKQPWNAEGKRSSGGFQIGVC